CSRRVDGASASRAAREAPRRARVVAPACDSPSSPPCAAAPMPSGSRSAATSTRSRAAAVAAAPPAPAPVVAAVVVSSGAVRLPGTPSVPRRRTALADGGRRRGGGPGSEVSPADLLEHLVVERQVGDQALQPRVL